jgi:hypothetical protein
MPLLKKKKKIQIMIITYNKSAVLALLLCLIKMYFLSEKKKNTPQNRLS